MAEAKTLTAVFMREELGHESAEEAVDSHTRTIDPSPIVGDEEPRTKKLLRLRHSAILEEPAVGHRHSLVSIIMDDLAL